jgi:hypothetical protein
VEAMLRTHLGDDGILMLTTHRPIDLGGHKVHRISLGV